MNQNFSIIICTYNGEKYIEEVVESIILQDGYDEYINELKIVDNASTDSTKSLVLDLIKNNKSKKINYVLESNPGLSNARKHIKDIKTEWTIFFDDDNVLMDNWIINTVKFTQKNSECGVINSNSIAKPDFDISDEKLVILKALLPSLACTHINISELKEGVESMIQSPFGAGICLKTNPVIEMLNDGWTKNVGRKGNDLGSGEDGEIARYVIDKGYKFGYNNNSSFFHYIPEFRLSDDYIKKLNYGLAKGTYEYISLDKSYICKRIKLLIKSLMNIIEYPFKSTFEKKLWKKEKLKMSLYFDIYYLKRLIKDFIILKKI